MGIRDYLDIAYGYALKASGCCKVAVGSAIIKDDKVIALGANQAHPNKCKTARGCLRIEKYGNDSKAHRDPADCRAVHSEIDAICAAAVSGTSTKDATICVTRYPCESCARAIVAAGIKNVFYGGTTKISDETGTILEDANINVYYIDGWREDNTDR